MFSNFMKKANVISHMRKSLGYNMGNVINLGQQPLVAGINLKETPYVKHILEKFEQTLKNLEPMLKCSQYDVKVNDIATVNAIELNSDSLKNNNKYMIVFQGRGAIYESLIEEMIKLSKESGINIVSFNYRGIHKSIGKANSSKDLVEDGVAVVKDIMKRKNISSENILLYGECMGAAIATKVAGELHKEDKKVFLFNDRSFSTLSDLIEGYVKLNYEQKGKKVTGNILSKIAHPFINAILSCTGWEMNTVDDFNEIPDDYKDYVVVRSKSEDRKREYRYDDGLIDYKASLDYGISKVRKSIEKELKNAKNPQQIEKAKEKLSNFFKESEDRKMDGPENKYKINYSESGKRHQTIQLFRSNLLKSISKETDMGFQCVSYDVKSNGLILRPTAIISEKAKNKDQYIVVFQDKDTKLNDVTANLLRIAHKYECNVVSFDYAQFHNELGIDKKVEDILQNAAIVINDLITQNRVPPQNIYLHGIGMGNNVAQLTNHYLKKQNIPIKILDEQEVKNDLLNVGSYIVKLKKSLKTFEWKTSDVNSSSNNFTINNSLNDTLNSVKKEFGVNKQNEIISIKKKIINYVSTIQVNNKRDDKNLNANSDMYTHFYTKNAKINKLKYDLETANNEYEKESAKNEIIKQLVKEVDGYRFELKSEALSLSLSKHNYVDDLEKTFELAKNIDEKQEIKGNLVNFLEKYEGIQGERDKKIDDNSFNSSISYLKEMYSFKTLINGQEKTEYKELAQKTFFNRIIEAKNEKKAPIKEELDLKQAVDILLGEYSIENMFERIKTTEGKDIANNALVDFIVKNKKNDFVVYLEDTAFNKILITILNKYSFKNMGHYKELQELKSINSSETAKSRLDKMFDKMGQKIKNNREALEMR